MFVSESTSRPNRKCTPFPSDGARLRSDRLDLLGLISSLGTVFRCFARYSLPVTTPFTSCPWTTLSSARPFSPTTSLTRVKNSCGYLYLEKEANTRVDDKNVDCCISAAQTDNVNKLSDRKYGKRIFGRVGKFLERDNSLERNRCIFSPSEVELERKHGTFVFVQYG